MVSKIEEKFSRSDLLKRMVGDVSFHGETNHDNDSFDNLEVLNSFIGELVDISFDVLRQTNGRNESSAKNLNDKVINILRGNKESIDELIEIYGAE
ncbi:hypothetical protein [Fructobacillus tropaeoli]|uniref:Uncharacterized protein n=1 Tax=Fructobacillus tropaeoli TaxID=709323 RepID=A0A3F3H4B7_9LACO|nr:hypothetical protein [Fructobacillus tropaeoli]GAP05066.1 hypothetical protein FTRO_0340040 [Fructobacillus tropaeoli]